MARTMLDSISKNKKNLNNTKVKSKDILPVDFCEEKYLLTFDPATLTITVVPKRKADSNVSVNKSHDSKKSILFIQRRESSINMFCLNY